MKSCTKCNNIKEFSKFHKNSASKDGHLTICKTCVKAYQAENKERLKKSRQEYYKANKEQILKRAEKWRNKNKDKYLESCRKSRIKNKDKINKYYKKRLKDDPVFALKKRLRTRIRDYFQQRNISKNKSTKQIIGLSFQDLSSYLESTFVENYGILPTDDMDLHIDHIKPLSIARTQGDLEDLNFFTNLQLLFSDDNMEKGNKLWLPTR